MFVSYSLCKQFDFVAAATEDILRLWIQKLFLSPTKPSDLESGLGVALAWI